MSPVWLAFLSLNATGSISISWASMSISDSNAKKLWGQPNPLKHPVGTLLV
jgi:hypothetical protein